jgi:hypothetical protein
MIKDAKFEQWKSRVEFYLQLMVKKSLGDFDWYNYHQDYYDGVRPEHTATRVIQENTKTKIK